MVRDGRIGQVLGRYRVDSQVGQGGFATVYRALDTVLERPVALKVLDPAALRDPTNGKRFLREGKAVANLDHPAIVPVYDAGDDDGTPWMAMRLVEGGSLEDALADGRTFTREDVVSLVRRIASALDHAHSHGLIHRDVKPSNILLEQGEAENAWLTDFGIAVTVRSMGLYTTGALGTAAYMAPEQAQPNQAGPPADLYSLACVAYELLVGERPFPGRDYVALLLAHARDPVPVTGDPAVDNFMARALAKDPDSRPASGKELTADLRRVVEETTLPPTAAAPTREPPPPPVAPGDAPTVVDIRDRTLIQPADRLPGPAEPAPPPSGDGIPAPLIPGPGAGYPSDPGYSPPLPHPPAPGGGRGRGRRRLLVGLVLLTLVGAVTLVATLMLRDPVRRIHDDAGVSYELPREWNVNINAPLTTITAEASLDEGGTVMATLAHRPADGADVLGALLEADECTGQTTTTGPPPGADAMARCTNAEDDEVAVVVAVSAADRLWIVTVRADAPAGKGSAFLDSLEFTPPTT